MQQIVSQWELDLQQENKDEEEIMDKLLNQTTPVQLAEVGYLLYNLYLKSLRRNRNDKITITFKYKEEQLPQQLKLAQGDQVSVFDWSKVVAKTAIGDSKREGSGVIEKIYQSKIRIVCDGSIEKLLKDHNYCICITTNTVTYRRNKKVLSLLKSSKSPLIEALFPSEIKQQQESALKSKQYQMPSYLNESQQRAVQSCLNMDRLALIHGPPGTGKTRTLCEYLVQAVRLNKFKILATAASNIAVDNMVERVGQLDPSINVCRLGHPARVIDSIQNKCLSALQKKSPLFASYKQLKRDIQKLQHKIERAEKKERRELKDKLKQLMKDKSFNERMLAKEVVEDSQIIFCTNVGASDKLLREIIFDVVAIDECAQAIEISCWIPILRGLRLVVAGDHKQLPPTVKSRNAASLSYTLFERIIDSNLTQNRHLLDVQYRMNENIMKWSSDEVYEGKLKADQSVKEHSLKDLNPDANTILLFIDTSGCDLYEAEPVATNSILKELFMSKFNEGEAQLVQLIVDELLLLNVRKEDIGVISPYSAQVALLKKTISDIEVSTVDGFQGREKECIIISMVRSNKYHEVGFLSEYRRMNVAVTRAKRFVCLIGNSETVGKDPFLNRMIIYFEEVGETRSAKQYQLETNMVPQNTEQKQDKQKKKKKKPVKKSDETQKQQKQFSEPIEDCEEKSKYERILRQFAESSDNEFVIKDLNAFERRIIHEIAENLNLNHQSIGNGESKNMKISKQNNVQQNIQIHEEEKKVQQQQQNKQFSQPQNNIKENVFNQLKGQDSDDNIPVEDKKLEKQKEKPVERKQKKPKQEKKQKTQQEKQDSEDEFFNSLKPSKDPKYCAYKECQSLTNILKSSCKHCLMIYCGFHNLPEEHGCGEAAQRDARNKVKTADKETQQRLGEKIKQKQQERGKKDTKKK